MRKKLLNLCLAALLSTVNTAAWALSEVNGVYQIGTAEDLKAFAELVNGGEFFANAVLTADIDKGTDGTMIGRNNGDYQGVFDGQGHTITINLFRENGDDDTGIALFRNIGMHAVIQNLKVQGNITTSKKFAGGIVVYGSGRIRGCYVDVNVTSAMAGDATHGGIVADAYRGTFIENCLAKFTINGATTQNCGGLIGWCENPVNIANCLVISDGSSFDLSNNGSANIARNDGNIRVVNLNTYNNDIYANRPNGASYNNYVTNQWGNNKATTVVAYDNLADGRICYQLNNDQSHINWVQQIGVDPFPVPAAFGSGQVFASAPTDCDGKSEGELTFSNEGTAQATAHNFDKYGICSQCGCFNTNGLEFDAAENCVLLKTADDIYLAEGWNRIGDGFKLNMKMANDIECIADPGQYIFNTSNWVDGDFNGDGHTLTIEISDVGNDASFIPQHTGVFENVIMRGSISTTGQYAGSISGRARQATVRNVFSDIEINANHTGDNTSGGLFGIAYNTKHVDNCIYAGNLNGIESTECIAGFCGWADGTTHFNNCAFLGTLNNCLGDSRTISRNLGKVITENVYSLTDYGLGDSEKFIEYTNEAGVESGELAYFLNGKGQGVERFYQKIGEDLMPMPIKKEGALVYASASSYRCDGEPEGETVYTNNSSGSTVVLPPHKYKEGFCSVCGHMQENFLTPVDGWFEISNGAELAWWSNYAAKHLNASARLTDDINMEGYSERWADIGTRGAPFYGSFDGQFHTISNLNIYRPGTDGAGLIGIMNSQPSSGFGGLSDNDARAAEGVFIKNVVLDETCSIYAHGYAAIVGMTANWAGHITFEGLMMLGDVTVDGGVNGGGILGCVMNEACRVTINNCGMIGNIYSPNASHSENGSFSGWIGKWAELTNCFAIGEVENMDTNRGFARHYVGSADHKIVIKNCYALDGVGIKQTSSDSNDIEDVSFVSSEELETGAITWKANGYQFRTPYWYQTLGDDPYPYPYPTHGTVIYAADQYFSVLTADDIADVASEVQYYEKEAIGETIATQSLLDELNAAIESLTDATTVLDFADAIDTVSVKKQAVTENAKVYQAYIDKCEEVKAYLASNSSFAGALRESLEYYLSEVDEPSEDNPLGTYEYIVEIHTATAEEIAAETDRVTAWLQQAIADDYVPGTDVSKLISNYDFSKQKQNWTGGWCTGYGQTQDEESNTFHGVEAWNVTGDMYQTVEGMKPGYYLVGTNGAFRPSNNRYSTNYAAGIYANGIFNYFPTVIEDYVPVDEAEDGVNCNLTIKSAYDLAIYDDNYSTDDTNGATLLGYAVHGETGMAIAAKANRYQAYTIAYVGEDGKLTIGIKNPGTKYSNDWTGWSALKVIYYGDDEDMVNEALDVVLDNMKARAETIIAYEYDEETAAAGPNFPAVLREAVEEAAAATAETIEAKAALAAKFSELFENIYEGKQAYIALYNAGDGLGYIEGGNLPLVEKDESGEWYETGDMVFSLDEMDVLADASGELLDAYYEGTYSTEEALDAAALSSPEVAEIVPVKDEEGYYLISTPKHFVAYRAICNLIDKAAKAKLVNDVDMSGIAMEPIGNSSAIWAGTLDGLNNALTNVYINWAGQRCALFYELQNATVKNLKLTGEYYTSDKYMGSLAGYTSQKSTIENCEFAVVMHSAVNGDGTHGGIMGVNHSSGETLVKNCLVNCSILSEEGFATDCCGGICGWSDHDFKVQNTLILSEYTIGGNGSNTVSRHDGYCTVSNVFYLNVIQGDGTASGTMGTKVSEEQLATGEIAYKLNGSQSETPVWFQTLGTDAAPHLFDGATVYYYGGQYINDKPNPQLNAFAYNLEANVIGSNVVVSYTLNAEAEAVKVNFYDGETLVYTAETNDVFTAGTHKVSVPASQLGSDPTALSYEVAVTGKGSLDVLKIGESYKVYGPYGMAINNNPTSKSFGQVLLAESWVEDYGEGYISTEKPGALFAFDAAFQPINAADGTPGFYGGLDIANETPLVIADNYKFDLKDIRFTADGRLFVARAAGLTPSSVYELNPENLDEAWKPVFTGGELDEATGITYVGDEEQTRMAVSLAFEGAGEDLKMYVLGGQRSNGEKNTTDYNCSIYNLGTATEWSGAPSANFEPLDGAYTYVPSYVGIQTDGQGGLWFIQSAGTRSAEIPALKHFDAEGKEDYSDISTATNGSRIAVTADGKYLAIPMGSGKIVLYETNYVPMANGKIYLDPKFNISVGESSITSLAFDYANNLYVASGGTETFSRYAIPGTDKVVVTPGNGIGTGTGANGDLNGDGKVDIADAVTVLNIMAQGSNNPTADLNGDGKVDIADFVTVLNIMAQQ